LLHVAYLDSYVQAALRDGVVTTLELEIIHKISKALNLNVQIPDQAMQISENGKELRPGKTVCFTGTAISSEGSQIMRSELEALAAKVGLHPVSAVTKKGCDFVVAADEATMSNKAKKAREWGIEVISVNEFLNYCTSK
jgi:DNA polymerase-3 subunit epsilon